jgi:hypothetical protein
LLEGKLKKNSIRQRLMASTVASGAALLALTAVPAVALLAPTTALAQSQTGGLRIAVTGSDGQPVAGATVAVSSPDSLISKSGVTGADGRVRLAGLDPATNYTVNVSASGYSDFSASEVAVVSGRDLSLGYALSGGDAASLDDVIVTGTSLAAVDVTSATVGTTLTLQTVDALPTGRNYQSFLQLVPGVKPSATGNPSSRSGVNYADIGGATGQSTDNLYYLDGVDVTDPSTGTFGANFNSEIIQEQQVIVGGVPAEYAGGSGLISRVITKSGGNEWQGSVNYYFQNDSLVADDEHNSSGGFSTYDTAFTFGGPIIRDRLWFFSSYQKRSREDDVLNGAGAPLRTVTNEGEYAFAKVTWQATDNDRLSVSYFSDPSEISGSALSTTPNNRDTARLQGGDNFKVDYSHTWGDLLVNAYWFRHEGELTDVSADQTIRDDVAFLPAANATVAQRSLGGFGRDIERHKDREEFGLNAEYYLDTGFGTHTLKVGYTRSENVYEEDSTVPGGATYRSLAPAYAGTTFAQYTDENAHWTQGAFVLEDIARIRTALALPAYASARAAVDTNNDGAISDAEVNAISFTNTTGSPYGNINAYRSLRTVVAPYAVTSEGQSVYLQDTWTLNQLTVNAGLRAEKWEHFASDGSQTATFDWEIAPRLSLVYDMNGDGRSKLFGFVGRYYDPIRNTMSDFAGALTGPVDNEQININGDWVTFRVRGGASTPDALFAPSTKTPYTDEYMLGYSTTFGSSIGFSASVTHRATRDLLEDFDLGVYSNPNGSGTGIAGPNSLFYLPYSYFGYTSKPNSNYVIGTLPGGERNYTGLELTLTKFKTDNWFGQVSYTFNKAEGNTNSDSNADYQGDVLWLDPRAPNVYGKQAGNIPHQFKAYGSYEFDFGLQLSGVFNWNSGFLYTPASLVDARYFAPRVSTAYEYGGATTRWLQPGFVAGSQTPAYYTFDVRLKYVMDMPSARTSYSSSSSKYLTTRPRPTFRS